MPEPLIAHIVYSLDYGGLENGLVNLLNGLPQGHYRHTVICLSHHTAFRERIRRDDITLHALDKQPGKDPGCYLRLWRLLRMLRPALVHTRNPPTMDCQPVAWAAGVPRRIHGLHGWDMDDLHGTSARQRMLRRACRPFIQHWVSVSLQMAQWLHETDHIDAAGITHICNGVDTSRFRPPVRTPGHPRVIGTVGRLEAVKNQQLLLDAFAGLLQQRPALRDEVRLLLVGDGSQRAALEARAAALGIAGQVDFTGNRDEVPELLQAMDIFVLPSLNEGIANTVLEAMASGLPVIATQVGGNAELIRDNATGFVVPGQDPAAMTHALTRYLDDPELCLRHGRAARERAEQEFSIGRMLERYHALYQHLLHDHRETS